MDKKIEFEIGDCVIQNGGVKILGEVLLFRWSIIAINEKTRQIRINGKTTRPKEIMMDSLKWIEDENCWYDKKIKSITELRKEDEAKGWVFSNKLNL